MKIYDTRMSRAEYLQTQIARSDAKFNYCKVSTDDARKYADIINRRRQRERDPDPVGPIVCLGTRNGREIDLFRIQFFGPLWLRALSRGLERQTRSFMSLLPRLESLGRSEISAIHDGSVVGVELNPRAARSDVWIGSFDAMPEDWTGKFGVVYSNSFDQSENPERTAREWIRVIRPMGYLVFCFSNDAAPTSSDPVGGLSLADVRALFGGELVCFQDRGSRNGYSEVILRVTDRA